MFVSNKVFYNFYDKISTLSFFYFLKLSISKGGVTHFHHNLRTNTNARFCMCKILYASCWTHSGEPHQWSPLRWSSILAFQWAQMKRVIWTRCNKNFVWHRASALLLETCLFNTVSSKHSGLQFNNAIQFFYRLVLVGFILSVVGCWPEMSISNMPFLFYKYLEQLCVTKEVKTVFLSFGCFSYIYCIMCTNKWDLSLLPFTFIK